MLTLCVVFVVCWLLIALRSFVENAAAAAWKQSPSSGAAGRLTLALPVDVHGRLGVVPDSIRTGASGSSGSTDGSHPLSGSLPPRSWTGNFKIPKEFWRYAAPAGAAELRLDRVSRLQVIVVNKTRSVGHFHSCAARTCNSCESKKRTGPTTRSKGPVDVRT